MAIYLRAKGRTSPPAKTIGHRESINPTLTVLKLVAKYLVTTIYSNMQQKKRSKLNRRKICLKVRFFGNFSAIHYRTFFYCMLEYIVVTRYLATNLRTAKVGLIDSR